MLGHVTNWGRCVLLFTLPASGEQATVLILQCTLTVTVSIGQSICQVLAYRSQPSLSLKWSLVSSSYLLVLEVLCAIVNCSTLFANKVNRIQQFENSDALYL